MTNQIDEIREIIGIAIGEASMCWSEVPTGTFDSTRAVNILERVMAAIEKERDELKLQTKFVIEYLNPADTSFRNMINNFVALDNDKKQKLINLAESLAECNKFIGTPDREGENE